jgi:hypothetical protein
VIAPLWLLGLGAMKSSTKRMRTDANRRAAVFILTPPLLASRLTVSIDWRRGAELEQFCSYWDVLATDKIEVARAPLVVSTIHSRPTVGLV